MLLNPTLTTNFHPTFMGQDGIRHDLNRLYYNAEFFRSDVMDGQVYPGAYSGSPYSYAPQYSAPYSYTYWAPNYGYAAQPFVGQPSPYAMPSYYPYEARMREAYRPFGRSYFEQSFRPELRGYEAYRPEFRAFEPVYRPEIRGYEHAFRPELRPELRSWETFRPEIRGYEGIRPELRSWDRPMESPYGMAQDSQSAFCPATNWAEAPDAFLLVVELPGVELKDITLQILNASLVLNAFRRPTWSNGSVTVNYHFTEGRFGTLRRVLPLPAGVLPGQIQANFINGMLTILIPKTAQASNQAPQASIVINSAVPTSM